MSRENPRLALLIPSYSRVHDLLRQVFSMVSQPYKNIHIFVSVKGVTEACYEEVIVSQLQPLVDSGILTLHLDGNANQMINFIDAVRGADMDEFDLFLKIDDDDIYHPEYLKYCAGALRLSPPDTSTYYAGDVNTLDAKRHGVWRTWPTFNGGIFEGFGNMLGLSRPVMKHLFEAEANPEILKEDGEKIGWDSGDNIGWREDRYYFELIKLMGPHVNLEPVFTSHGIKPSIIGGHTMANSLTRNAAYRSSDFLNKVSVLKEPGGGPREWVIETSDDRLLKIFDGYFREVGSDELHRYASFGDGMLATKGGVVYKRRADGRYHVEAGGNS